MKKLLLIFVFLTSVTTPVILFLSPAAHAWSGNLATCTLTGFDWQTALASRLGHTPTNTDRFILAKTSTGSQRFVIYYASSSGQGVGLLDSPNSVYLYSGAHRAIYDNDSYALLNDTTFSDNTFTDPYCISYANNLSMNTQETTYPTYDFSASPSPTPTPTPSSSPSPSPSPVAQPYINLNPYLMSDAFLESASASQILAGIYRLLVAQFCISLALVVFYFLFRYFEWFLPKFWIKPELDRGER